MIKIDNIALDPTYKILNVMFTLDAAHTPDSEELVLYIGSCYLAEKGTVIPEGFITKPDAVTRVASIPVEYINGDPFASIPVPEASGNDGCPYSKPIYDGIFTVVASQEVGGEIEKVEKAIINAYYSTLCLSHMTLAIDNPDKLNETNLLYLLILASVDYIQLELIEQALAAYEKVEAICESAPKEFYQTDVNACGQGMGCWIVNGVYVKR